ncbi:MAG TPA: hypothetical protein VNG69_13180 [Casimicrobiaceae bacterium]|nr:hypothetical protein [Casimicrobiaceae bacterium]
MKRADPNSRPRFEIDRTWVIRGVIALLVIALLLLIAKVSMMAFDKSARRLDRFDPGHVKAAPADAEKAAKTP